MRNLYRFIIFLCLLITSSAYALDYFLEPLYWRATESVDWMLNNNLSSTNQNVTYKTLAFNFEPGVRVGVGREGEWDSKIYYTRFYTNTNDAASGNLTSAFLGGKLVQSNPSFFYTSGQVHFVIDYNMLDWNAGKKFQVTDALILHPFIGLAGGWINQSIDSSFQGQKNVTENIVNDFAGAGPKAGVESKILFMQKDLYQLSFVTDFSTAYLWGRWKISDISRDSTPSTVIVKVGTRYFGSLAIHAFVGANVDYQKFSVRVGYEMNDYFNQCQIFDDATGPHNNDLILQGATLRLTYTTE